MHWWSGWPKRRAARPSISGCDTLIVDTAGRLALDEQLMQEMRGPEGAT